MQRAVRQEAFLGSCAIAMVVGKPSLNRSYPRSIVWLFLQIYVQQVRCAAGLSP